MTEPQAIPGGEPAILFGPFRLVATRRLLLEGDKPVRLGSRAFDVLTTLVENAGEVVSKEELITRAWPQTFVEEANLKIQISALRRALGDGQGDNRYVATIARRATISLHRYTRSSRRGHFPRRCRLRSLTPGRDGRARPRDLYVCSAIIRPSI